MFLHLLFCLVGLLGNFLRTGLKSKFLTKKENFFWKVCSVCLCLSCYRCYCPHRSGDSVSPLCRIFSFWFWVLPSTTTVLQTGLVIHCVFSTDCTCVCVTTISKPFKIGFLRNSKSTIQPEFLNVVVHLKVDMPMHNRNCHYVFLFFHVNKKILRHNFSLFWHISFAKFCAKMYKYIFNLLCRYHDTIDKNVLQ